MRDVGKELFDSEIDITIGSQWPTMYVVTMSSHGVEAARVSFDDDAGMNAFDIEQWADLAAREHYPDSDYAKSPPLGG